MSDLDQHNETASILVGDCLSRLREIQDGSARCCVTSPPYYGLRDYGVAGQIGAEQTPEEYVARLVEVFREVRRVLTEDGTLWLNLGDSYGRENGPGNSGARGKNNPAALPQRRAIKGIKQKDLIGIPWMTAFALRADGWYLRSDIIWHKPNVMPESVRDRPTKAHEYLFLLSKSERYYYDREAVLEPFVGQTEHDRGGGRYAAPGQPAHSRDAGKRGAPDAKGRNKRSVWSVNTKPFKGAHFAVFPSALIEPCVLAGSQTGDVVLDPFTGSGTTGMVAREHGRRFLGVELNPDYAAMAWERISNGVPRPQLTKGVAL